MQIDLKGWGVGYIPSFQHHCLLQMLNSVAGIREYFSQTDERATARRIPVMVNMAPVPSASKKSRKMRSTMRHHRSASLDVIYASNRNALLMDEYSDQEASTSVGEFEHRRTASEDETQGQIDLSIFSGNISRDDDDNGRKCWKLSDANNFRVRSKNFCVDKSKIPAGKPLMDLVAVDWFKDTKRIDYVARCCGCAAQVASEKGYFSIVVNLQLSISPAAFR